MGDTMQTSDFMPTAAAASDAELVTASLAGDRDAFTRIVERYQRLLCSLAYSTTGSVSESEDAAQEAFITAWKQLPNLREPEKLRPWLCGILRFKLSRARRDDGREPVRGADGLEAAEVLPSGDSPAVDSAMQREEQALLWRVLQDLPENYREPLVLYYRENRSVEHVACALELSEDAVKQRLSRGRRLVQEQMLAFVEGALARSTPGRVFTLGVLAALPEFAAPARAAAIGAAAAAHGGMLAKTTSLAALLASVSGVVNLVVSLRAALDQSRTPRERRAVVRTVLAAFGGTMVWLALLYGLRTAAYLWWEHRAMFAACAQVLVLAYIAAWPLLMVRMILGFAQMRTEERRRHPELFRHAVDQPGSTAGEYRSRWRLFGVPLVHVRFAMAEVGSRPLVAWIAAGDRAYGLLVAWGNIAIAPVSVGVVSVGLLSVGALSFGVIGLGTVAVGALALGCATVGVKAYAWLTALGWDSAQSGGFSIARIAAEGPIAFARHANDPIARELLADPHAERNQMIFFVLIAVMSIVPLVVYARALRARIGAEARRTERSD
ncbi:sigma-70 family RNA polymerase sigma factor [Opitutales bacterium ASA1]|nr:sigma-70 family RNA polymerase sigma factor [Opitutales bacterium ASA1]